MLILHRKVGEAINIGDDILLVVTRLDNGSVRIGIQAPKHIPVHRGEIYERILLERASRAKDAVEGASQAETGSGAQHSDLVEYEDRSADQGLSLHADKSKTLSLGSRRNAK